jgi:hypothetical protein
MPDIAMCHNKNCKKKQSCYRYLAKPDLYQAYFSRMDEVDGCEYYVDVKTYLEEQSS